MTTLQLPGINLADALRPHGRRVVIIGDDLSLLATADAYDARRWWVWAMALAGWPFELAGVSAADGRTTADMVGNFSEVTALVASGGPIDEAWIRAGQNDLTDADSAAAGLAAFDALVAACHAAGIARIRAVTVNPRRSGAMSGAVQQALLTFNLGLIERGRAGTVHVIDSAAALRDLSQTDGSALGALMADDLHPTSAGALREGLAVAAAIAGIAVPLDDFALGTLDTVALNPGYSRQLLDNPMFGGSGGSNDGGATVTLPAGWTFGFAGAAIAGAVTSSTETSPRQRHWHEVAFSGTLTDPAYFGLAVQWVFDADTKGVTPGSSRVRARLSVKAAGLSANFSNLPFQLQFYDTGFGRTGTATCLAEMGDDLGDLPAVLTLEIPATLVPATTKHIAFRVDARFAVGACAGSISLSEPQLRLV